MPMNAFQPLNIYKTALCLFSWLCVSVSRSYGLCNQQTLVSSILRRAHTHMLLKELSEEALIREIHVHGNLFDAFRAVFQQYANLENDIVINPLVGCTAAYLFHGFRQIFRGDAQLFGIPSYASFPFIVLFHQTDKLGEDDIGTRLAVVVVLLRTEDNVAQVVEHGQEQCSHHVAAEKILGIRHLLFNQIEVTDEHISLFL